MTTPETTPAAPAATPWPRLGLRWGLLAAMAAAVAGFFALSLASVNIFGGFLVTQRMLAMYKKKG